MRYSKPLITEIFVELHLKPNTFDAQRILDLAHQLRNDGFTLIEIVNAQKIISNEITVEPRIRCWTPDKSRLIQLSPDLLVVNCVGAYLGWDNFRSHLDKCLSWFEKSAGQLSVNSISLNMIDRTDTIKPDGFRLGDYLHAGGMFVPGSYQNSTSACDITLGLGLLNVDGFNRVVKIAVRPGADKVMIQIHTAIHRLLQNKISLHTLAEELHIEALEYFEALITDKTRSEVMGGGTAE